MPAPDGAPKLARAPLALMGRFFGRVTGSAAEPADSAAARRRFVTLLTIILCLGAANRIIHFAQARVLYNDELYLAESIRKFSFTELAGPLLHDQRAPIAFLFATKACWLTIGHNDLALRFVPLLGGLLGLFFFYPAARVFLSRPAALVALALFAGTEPLTFYSAELKPYAWDAMATIVVLWVVGPLASRSMTWKYALGGGIAGMVLPFWSFASVFTLASLGLVLAGLLVIQRRWKELPMAAAMGALWVAGIAALQYFQVRHYPKDISSWLWSWGYEFGRFPLFGYHSRAWFEEHLNQLVSHAVGLKVSTLAILAAVLGAIAMLRTKRYHFALLTAPIVTGLVLSHLMFYPFSGRLLLYLYPVVMIMIAFAVGRLLEAESAEARRWAIGAIALLLAPMVSAGIKNARDTRERQSVAYTNYSQAHIKYAMRFIKANWQPGDVLYLHGDSGKWVEHYAEQYGFEPSKAIHGVPSAFWHRAWEPCADHLAKTVKGKPRVWLLITQQGGLAINETMMYRYYLDKMGTLLLAYDPGYAESGHAYLYDLSAPPPEAK